jgi:hypothetical protein
MAHSHAYRFAYEVRLTGAASVLGSNADEDEEP